MLGWEGKERHIFAKFQRFGTGVLLYYLGNSAVTGSGPGFVPAGVRRVLQGRRKGEESAVPAHLALKDSQVVTTRAGEDGGGGLLFRHAFSLISACGRREDAPLAFGYIARE